MAPQVWQKCGFLPNYIFLYFLRRSNESTRKTSQATNDPSDVSKQLARKPNEHCLRQHKLPLRSIHCLMESISLLRFQEHDLKS